MEMMSDNKIVYFHQQTKILAQENIGSTHFYVRVTSCQTCHFLTCHSYFACPFSYFFSSVNMSYNATTRVGVSMCVQPRLYLANESNLRKSDKGKKNKELKIVIVFSNYC